MTRLEKEEQKQYVERIKGMSPDEKKTWLMTLEAHNQLEELSKNPYEEIFPNKDKAKDPHETFSYSKRKISDQNKRLKEKVIREFKLDIDGDHGFTHWERVYQNTLMLAKHYSISSDVFELFALLHDCKRQNEFEDPAHGKRAASYIKDLMNEGLITHLSNEDKKRLVFACSNHTNTNKRVKLYSDLVVQICFDADRLDIGRVGIVPEEHYFQTNYAKELIQNEKYFY